MRVCNKEIDMVTDDASFVVLKSRGLLTVGGKDRVEFLQGLISNDVQRVSGRRCIWAALLTPQGKYLHDFFVSEIDDIFFLDCEANRLVDLGQRLSRYKLRANVDLGMSEMQSVAVVFGNDTFEGLGLGDEMGAAKAIDGGLVYRDPRLSTLGLRTILDDRKAVKFLTARDFKEGTLDGYERWRLEAGVPDGSRDMIVEKSILLESNFDELNGVDWDKGCFMGQELTARTKYRGLIKKRLVPVRIEGAPPAPGLDVLFDGKNAGEMRTSFGGFGIALLRLEYLERVLAGEGTLQVEGRKIVPRKPDWANF